MNKKNLKYYVWNEGRPLIESRLLFISTGDKLFVNSSSNEDRGSGWIITSNLTYLKQITRIQAETFWPNCCNNFYELYL